MPQEEEEENWDSSPPSDSSPMTLPNFPRHLHFLSCVHSSENSGCYAWAHGDTVTIPYTAPCKVLEAPSAFHTPAWASRAQACWGPLS